MTRIFHWLFMGKMDPMSGFDIRLVFTLPPRDSTLQYKRCVHLWNNFPCIKSLTKFIIHLHLKNRATRLNLAPALQQILLGRVHYLRKLSLCPKLKFANPNICEKGNTSAQVKYMSLLSIVKHKKIFHPSSSLSQTKV